ncbi:hypothetical protein BURK2_00810 [Burkholderiales bacterium]|nr:hypothetical protein BURK2_00810 [Burkholderiales bacterium]
MLAWSLHSFITTINEIIQSTPQNHERETLIAYICMFTAAANAMKWSVVSETLGTRLLGWFVSGLTAFLNQLTGLLRQLGL